MSTQQLRMGEFVIDLAADSLHRNGETVHLKPQVFAVLAYLATHAGSLVTRDALIDHVWGRCEVDYDANLNTIMLQIRRALGDTATSPRYIETVPRKGFRVVAPVIGVDPMAANPRRRWAKHSLAAAALLVIAIVAAGPVNPDSSAAQALPADAHLVYARGKDALQNGDFEHAIALLEQTIETSPEFAPAHACLALAYAGHGAGDEAGIQRARLQLQRAMEIDPDNAMALTVAAQFALTHERRLDKARTLLDRALTQETSDPHTHLLSAWQYSASGKHTEAQQAIQQALLLDPLSPRINRNAAKIYEAAGDVDSARRFARLARDISVET